MLFSAQCCAEFAVSRHRPIMNLFEKHPWTSPDVFVAPNATVVGDVDINLKSNVMYGAVVRGMRCRVGVDVLCVTASMASRRIGDFSKVNIGAYTTIGDRTVVYTSPQLEGAAPTFVDIGDYVTIGAIRCKFVAGFPRPDSLLWPLAGPGCVLQSCVIQRGARIGAGAVIMEGALVEEFAEVAPGSVVHPGRRVPKGQEWGGNPIAFIRDLSKEELGHREAEAEELSDAAAEHSLQFLPVGNVYRDVSGWFRLHLCGYCCGWLVYVSLRPGGEGWSRWQEIPLNTSIHGTFCVCYSPGTCVMTENGSHTNPQRRHALRCGFGSLFRGYHAGVAWNEAISHRRR
jgi:gamma-carbonic anhydrase